MRILCLHGMGTNGRIFEAQLSGITAKLKAAGHEFLFVDGILDFEPGPEVKQIYPEGPFLSHYITPRLEDVEDAKDYLREVFEQQGPFDGLIGFSQGGALAASLLLDEEGFPYEESLRFAVFICACLPCNPNDVLSREQWEETVRSGSVQAGELSGLFSKGKAPDCPGDLTGPFMGRYCPHKTPNARLKLPTLHITGKQDPFAPQGRLLAEMSSKEDSMTFEHDFGHEVPRSSQQRGQIADLIVGLVDKVNLPVA